MTSKKFKIIFQQEDNRIVDVDYTVNDTVLAQRWFHKIKHLKNIPINKVESGLENLSDLRSIHQEFCDFANIPYEPLHTIDQTVLNRLHELYETHHERLSQTQNSDILYRFHHSIHYNENSQSKKKNIVIGWGVKEGPLTGQFDCGRYYESELKRNNIYLPWSELGKTPRHYWLDGEPNDQSRFNQLARPHKTFRAMFAIALYDLRPKSLDPAFVNWFSKYKEKWFAHHRVERWNQIDEYCAPLLASTDANVDLTLARFKRIQSID